MAFVHKINYVNANVMISLHKSTHFVFKKKKKKKCFKFDLFVLVQIKIKGGRYIHLDVLAGYSKAAGIKKNCMKKGKLQSGQ